jgi:hypothetical protein
MLLRLLFRGQIIEVSLYYSFLLKALERKSVRLDPLNASRASRRLLCPGQYKYNQLCLQISTSTRIHCSQLLSTFPTKVKSKMLGFSKFQSFFVRQKIRGSSKQGSGGPINHANVEFTCENDQCGRTIVRYPCPHCGRGAQA